MLLDGHRASSRDDGAPSYEESKRTVIPLLERRVGEEAALNASVRHHYYEGILRAHDARRERRRRGEETDESADCDTAKLLASLLARDDPPLPPDVESGLSFPEYVFFWYSRRNRTAELLELGSRRPDELRDFLRNAACLRPVF